MRKHSFLFSVLKTIFCIAIIFLFSMMYWSSLLVEEDLQQIRQEIQNLKSSYRASPKDTTPTAKKTAENHPLMHPEMDPSLPNLLKPDPFYDTTLPKLLGPNFVPTGTIEGATVGKPDNLHPFSNWAQVASWWDMCNIAVAKLRFGFYEQYAPYAAIKVEERIVNDGKSYEYWIFLRDDMVWAPLEQSFFPEITLAEHFLKKHPVTAHDFKFQYDATMNPFMGDRRAVAMRPYLLDIEEVRVIDDYTFVVKWKAHETTSSDGTKVLKPKYQAKSITLGFTPLASFLYQYSPDGTKIIDEDQGADSYRLNSTFAQQFSEHWAKNIIPSCGSYKFAGMTDQSIRFVRNPDHFLPLECLVEGNRTQFKLTNESIWQSFKQGELTSFVMPADTLLEYNNFIKSAAYQAQPNRVLRLDYMNRSFSYIGWNEAKPLFKSKKVRQAMTMAIDRSRIIHSILQDMGKEISSPFFPSSEAYDPNLKPWPYDPTQARKILEEEGFSDIDGTGILSKKTPQGILRFEFSLSYYVKNATTKAICEYIATALKEIGVKCNLNGLDLADLSAMFDDKNFDAYFLAWVFGTPPEDLRQLWHSSGAKEKGSSNSIGFANAEVDEIIEKLTYEYNLEERKHLYHLFDRIFHEEQPYTLLYAPLIALLYRDYLQNVFLPSERQDLVPGATVAEPVPSIYWIKH